ncbi:hypothetical protein M409DRAFT_19291 [Zasmidium cellare ATCC 36951]|uniref:Cercosporin MFS transporter CTB4 n=1 Tax=Zasmidium cellare ATCC 36951 TaxID=1080233 RepID=A0A6A6CW95_ZASCE|nr:uncharacterized protein M409DRAFT_19291 [Zasmidium cellare ATCC 36951]KAF2170470.1 hypothetical protein M409DRAFT_19291 [Zasmidium cellare ATCC 36951]
MESQNLDLEQGSRASSSAELPGKEKPSSIDINNAGSSNTIVDGHDEHDPVEPEKNERQASHDQNLVSWEGPDDPDDPRNWPKRKKWVAVVTVSAYTLISSMSSSMVAPALQNISQDLGITNDVLTQMTLSIFVLAFAFGPLLLGPLSEVFGRVPVLQLANMFFLVWNLACGFAQNAGELIAFRFLAGIGGSAPLAIGAGVLGDCFTADQRGLAVSIYTLGPLLGPAIGPVAGGFIAETISWRWGFWIVTIADTVLQVLGLFFLRETYRPLLLARKLRRRKQETVNNALYAVDANGNDNLTQKLTTGFARPFRLLFTQPIIICLALFLAYINGLMYFIVSTFTALWTDHYGETTGIAGLNYIAMAIGLTIGAQGTARLTDRVYHRLKEKNGGVGLPEHRVLLMIPAAIGVPIGLLWYGWSAQAHIFWIMPDIGVAIYAASTIIGSRTIQSYVVDAYTRYAASAMAAVNTLRFLCAFSFPLFAPSLYSGVGYGWTNTILALVAVVLGIPAPWILWHYGERLRKRSKFAAGGR